jgi:hypothetical protein
MVKDSIAKSCSPKGHLIGGAAGWKIRLPAGDFYGEGQDRGSTGLIGSHRVYFIDEEAER